MLRFYTVLLRAQARVHEELRARRLSGRIDDDLPLLRAAAPALIRDVAAHASDRLAHAATELLRAGDEAVDGSLIAYWHTPSDTQFFGKALLQPYCTALFAIGKAPIREHLLGRDNRCPDCGGKPQLAVLAAGNVELEAGSRTLQCAMCLSTWPYGRVICANCGERDEPALASFQSPAWKHVSLAACDACRHYLKTVDLTRLGVAIPLVDEMAAVPLDLWARDHGYAKIEMNLIGL